MARRSPRRARCSWARSHRPFGMAVKSKSEVRIGFVGAGNYASSMLLPHLARLGTANLAHVATTKSLSAENAQQKFGFTTASTDSDAVFNDESLDAIFVVTRHATHAKLVCRALETGKAVFVEKPLALTRDETDAIAEAIIKTGNDRLMVGFNRRFAPLLTAMRSDFGGLAASSNIRYLVNAGKLAADSWYLNEEAEGSRFAGEGGHFIDTLSWWTDALPDEVYAVRGPEKGDLQATFRFRGGACRHHRLPHRREQPLPEGDDGRHRRRAQRTAGQLQVRHGLVGPREGDDEGPRRSGQGPARRDGAVRRGRQDRRPDADQRRLTARDDQGDDRGGREPGQRQAGGGVMPRASAREACLVRPQAQPDVARRGDLACPGAGAPQGLVAPAGAAGPGGRAAPAVLR